MEELLSKYRQELTERVLPFWLQHALDRVHGGYYNNVDRVGEIYDPRKHVWMQGRAAWMFSRIYLTLDPRPEYREAADCIFRFLHQFCRDQEPRCWFSLTEDGRPAAFQRKPYSAVFVVLALIEYSKLSHEPSYLGEAIELFWQIEEWVRHPQMLGRPVLAGALAYTQLADIYVLAWLASELHTVHDDERYDEIIERCKVRLRAHFDEEHNLFLENAALDEPAFRKYPEGRLACTGSSLEVSWLFLHILDTHPDPELEALLYKAILGALEYGWDKEFGGLYYFQDIEGRPPVALESNMKLWWPHTEAIYASALAYRNTRDERFLEWWRRVDEYAFRVFADAEHGEWFGYCDRYGKVASEMKGGPYKCAFHVPRMLLFTLQAFDRR